VRGRNYLLGLMQDDADATLHGAVHLDRRSRRALCPWLAGLVGENSPEQQRLGAYEGHRGVAGAAQALDFRTYLADDVLVKLDRAGMLSSLEIRAPFLDHRIVELAFGEVPEALRVTRTGRKILLARLARRLLPAGFDLERKQGFSLPLQAWFGGRWGAYAADVLGAADPRFFARGAVSRLFAHQRRGWARHTERIFSLLMFELWRRHYQVGD
jgi:asparagine synthase (glutamine-hydrolysing)